VSNRFPFSYASCLFLEEGCCDYCLYGYFTSFYLPRLFELFVFQFSSLHKYMRPPFIYSNRYYYTHSPSSPSSYALTLRRKWRLRSAAWTVCGRHISMCELCGGASDRRRAGEGWGLWSRVLLEMDVWARVWRGLLSIRRFHLQSLLNSTSSKSDSPPVLYKQSLDCLACAPGGRSVLPLAFQVCFFPLHFICPRADLTCPSFSCPSCPPPTPRHPSRKEPKPGELWLGSTSPR
jgi:hypothetical protein